VLQENCTSTSSAATKVQQQQVQQQQECTSNTSATTTPVQQHEGNTKRSGARGGEGQLALMQLASSTFPDRKRLRGEEEGRGKRREGETWRRGRQEWKREAMWLLSSTCCLPKSGRWRCP